MLIRFLFLWGVGFFFLVQARKLAEHRRKYERKREEKDMKERLARAQRIKEEREKAAKEEKERSGEGGGGGAGMGGMPNLSSLLSDPEIAEAFQDPEVASAFQDISHNPANILKYQSNPKISRLIAKMTQKLGAGGGGMPDGDTGVGGFPGGFPGSFMK